MADLMTDLKLIILLLTFVVLAKWAFEQTEKVSWVAAILVAIVMTYLIFQHEELAIGAFIVFFVVPQFVQHFLKGWAFEIKA